MKSTITRSIALLLLSAAVFTGCKKDDDGLAITKENVVGTYTLASMKVKATNVPEEDVTSEVEPCEKDDEITFKSDMTVVYKDAGVPCTPKGDGISVWSISGNRMTVSGDDFTVLSLSKSGMVITETYDDNGTEVTYTTTFKRK